MSIVLIAWLALAGVQSAVEADVVVLKNGDRITGTFVNVRSTNLTLQNDALGHMTIPIAKVASVSVNETVTVIVRGQPTLRGGLALGPAGNWQLTDDNGITRTIGAASVDVILPVERLRYRSC